MTPSPRAGLLFPAVFLAAGLSFFAFVATTGWREPLLDLASFRQTQTALSADYLLHDGFKLTYATPVLGAPWSLPFEFPLYQALVALPTRATGLPLDQSGRAVSLVFALAALALLFVFTARATGSRAAGCFAAALGCFTPVFAYYSRAFLIESTALCFALGLLVAAQDFILRPRLGALAWCFLAGLLAALTKATTYAVALAALAVLVATSLPALRARLCATGRPAALTLGAALAFAFPFAAALAWVAWTDTVKTRNPLAAFTTSAALHDWNYGTWSQRLSGHTWSHIASTSAAVLVGSGWLWLAAIAGLLAVAFFHRLPAFTAAAIATAGLLAGPLVFTNLYFVHDYYFYALALFAPLLTGSLAGAVWTHSRVILRAVLALVLLALAAAGVRSYARVYLPAQKSSDRSLLPLAEKIRQLIPPDTVLLIEGSEWDSALPYYAQHRALTNREALSACEPRLHDALARLDHPIGALVARAWARTDPEHLARQAIGLGATLESVYRSDVGDLYRVVPAPASPAPDSLWQRTGFSVSPLFFTGPAIELTQLAGTPVLFAHAPSLIVLPRTAAQHTLSFSFALRDDAYAHDAKTDGVTFTVDFYASVGAAPTRLFERRLTPATHPDDRGLQSATVTLPDSIAGAVLLRTLTGPTATCDWSVWRDVQLH